MPRFESERACLMPCLHMGGAIVCTRGQSARNCEVCRAVKGSNLCDWKLPNGRTCDAALCDGCTHKPAHNKDLCPTHAKRWAEIQAQRRALARKS